MRAEKKPFLIAIATCLFASATAIFIATASTPSKEVRKSINALAAACETESVSAFGALIAEDYRGEVALDKQSLLDKAEKAFKDAENLSVKIDYAEVIVDGATARAMVIYDVSGVYISSGVYSRAPFTISANRPVGELTGLAYIEFVEAGDQWLAEFVSWRGTDYLLDFPKAAKHLRGRF